jgi:glycosyltransferase involved in cell wall biosynthesis
LNQPIVSIVIPLLNEEESLRELAQWIRRSCNGAGLTYEVIFVDDGSRDRSWEVIRTLIREDAHIRGIRFARNYGKSAALHVGFEATVGDYIITMDADLQDSPDEIPALVAMLRDEQYDLVSGWKKKRYDPLSKTLPTKLFNWATRKMSGIQLHDFNCGLKAYKKDVVKSIEIFGEMHRYIPVIAHREGFRKIGEKAVEHRARKYGVSKFGFERFINGFLDLLTITFISRFGKKPMHFFGTLGVVVFMIGFLAFGYIGGVKLYALSQDLPAKNIAQQSGFFIALTAMIVGTQLFLAGFIGEMIVRNSSRRNDYLVSERI